MTNGSCLICADFHTVIFRGFLYISLISPEGSAKLRWAGRGAKDGDWRAQVYSNSKYTESVLKSGSARPVLRFNEPTP